jgi:ubiquinone/menaquinone biosynthesis C-methylase UbiE
LKEFSDSHQTQASIDKNSSFFRNNLDGYNRQVQELDTYKRIRQSINDGIAGCGNLLDIGNGGVFDYDTTLADSIVAIDLFLDTLPVAAAPPGNVTFKTGSALDVPEPDASFDAVLMVMLLHHLVGKTIAQSLTNMTRALSEALRVLKPGGKLVIVESCVPKWFYLFENAVFPAASFFIERAISHPPTLQYPSSLIASILRQVAPGNLEVLRIQKGMWVLQYGFKFPSILTPVCPFRFCLTKANGPK